MMMILSWWWQKWWFHYYDNDDDFVRSSAKPTSGWLMRPSIMICLRDNKSLTGIDLQLPILAHPFLMFARYFPLSTHVGGKRYKLLSKSDASTFFDFLPVFICDGGVLGEQVTTKLDRFPALLACGSGLGTLTTTRWAWCSVVTTLEITPTVPIVPIPKLSPSCLKGDGGVLGVEVRCSLWPLSGPGAVSSQPQREHLRPDRCGTGDRDKTNWRRWREVETGKRRRVVWKTTKFTKPQIHPSLWVEKRWSIIIALRKTKVSFFGKRDQVERGGNAICYPQGRGGLHW